VTTLMLWRLTEVSVEHRSILMSPVNREQIDPFSLFLRRREEFGSQTC
jgi:hypothetical protein